MIPEDLADDELKYELIIRNIHGISSTTEAKRKLKAMLRREEEIEIPAEVIKFSSIEAEEELRRCTAKIISINERLSVETTDEEALRLQSRLVHLKFRVTRGMRSSFERGGFEKVLRMIETAQAQIRSRWAQNQTQQQQSPRASPEQSNATDTDGARFLSRPPLGLGLELGARSSYTGTVKKNVGATGQRGWKGPEETRNRDNTLSPMQNEDYSGQRSQDHSQTSGRGLPIHKWNRVQFDGKPENLSRFLVRVRQFAEAEGATEGELFAGRVHLLIDDAADWLATRPDIRSWPALIEELIAYVRNVSSDSDRLAGIRAIRQGGEPVNAFITRLELAFQELRDPINGAQKVEIILSGMNQALKQLLVANTGINSVTELRSAARRVERVMFPTGLPTETRQNQSFPNMRPPVTNNTQFGGQNMGSQRSGPRGDGENLQHARRDECFKCGKNGHWRNECPEISCWGCGRPNTLRRNCGNCQGNQNGSR